MSRKPLFNRSRFDLAIDLGPEKQHQSGNVEPHQQNNDSAKRAVGQGIKVEKVQIDVQAKRGKEPEEHSHNGA